MTAILLCTCVLAGAQSLQEQQRRRDALEKDISILQRQLSNADSRSEQILSSLSILQARKKSYEKLLRQSDATIASYNDLLTATQRQINRKQAALDTLKAHYSRLVMGAYKNRDVRIWYMYILASEDMSQAFRRFSYFKNLSAQLAVQAGKIEKMKEELGARREELRALKKQAQVVRNDREKVFLEAQAGEKEQRNLVNKLKKDKKAYQASLKAKQEEKRVLDRQISRMLEQASGSSGKGKRKQDAADIALAASFGKNAGKLPWPVDGPVTEHYGAYQNKELHLSLFNNGINIACDPGSRVEAVFDGVVENIMIAPGYGQCILIRHGDYYTTYCKVRNATVHQGDRITTGQTIGEVATIMGKTQLYFLVYRKKYLDPEKWLRRR